MSISKLAYVHPDARIGRDVTIEPFASIYGDVVIGEGTWIGPNCTLMDGARIGSNCRIFPGAVVSAIPSRSNRLMMPAKSAGKGDRQTQLNASCSRQLHVGRCGPHEPRKNQWLPSLGRRPTRE